MNVCVHLFCVCVVLCRGRGLAIGWSPIQRVLLTVYKIKKRKSGEDPTKGYRGIGRLKQNNWGWGFAELAHPCWDHCTTVALVSSDPYLWSLDRDVTINLQHSCGTLQDIPTAVKCPGMLMTNVFSCMTAHFHVASTLQDMLYSMPWKVLDHTAWTCHWVTCKCSAPTRTEKGPWIQVGWTSRPQWYQEQPRQCTAEGIYRLVCQWDDCPNTCSTCDGLWH
jgi:hypothetical protein